MGVRQLLPHQRQKVRVGKVERHGADGIKHERPRLQEHPGSGHGLEVKTLLTELGCVIRVLWSNNDKQIDYAAMPSDEAMEIAQFPNDTGDQVPRHHNRRAMQ
jgi:hypothetical protein